MFYTIYKTTNLINGKIYIGKHETLDANDDYMGSGKNIKRALAKYGIENFKKEILFIFGNEEEMDFKEAELVTKEFVLEDTNYNICPGGQGGWGYVNNINPELRTKGHNTETFNKISKSLKGRVRTDISNSLKIAYADNRKIVAGAFSSYGVIEMSLRAQLSHVKEKRKKTRKENNFQQGKNNSQYGTTWIWHELYGNKKIKKETVEEYLKQGWTKTYKPGYKIP